MTNQEIKSQKKATALNSIRKIYHPLTKNNYSSYPDDGSYAEQRDSMVREIMEKLEKELQQLKNKSVLTPVKKTDEEIKIILNTRIYDLTRKGTPNRINIPFRASLNFYRFNIKTFADLVVCKKEDLLRERNFGKKSLQDIEIQLASIGLSFGMDIEKYK